MNGPDLAAVLADPVRTAEVPVEAIPALLGEMTATQARLRTLEQLLLARLVTETTNNARRTDYLVTADEAAKRLSTTKDWLTRHGKDLPFVVRLSDGQVRFSVKGIDRFIASRIGR